MHSTASRLSTLSSNAVTALFTLLVAIALSSFALTPSKLEGGRLTVEPLNVVMGRSKEFRGGPTEYAFANFDVKADLSPLFHWNTKQLLLQLTASYTTPPGTPNSVVLWDKIIQTPQKAKLDISGARNKYAFKEVSASFAGVTNLTYTLDYHLMPYVGWLQSGEVTRAQVVVDQLPKPKQKL